MIKHIPEVCRDQRKNLACAAGYWAIISLGEEHVKGSRKKDKSKIHLG